MGKYDKIKVYKDSAWVKPKTIYVYNNTWMTLGEDDYEDESTLTEPIKQILRRPLYVYSNDTYNNMTKVWKATTNTSYINKEGPFTIPGYDRLCFGYCVNYDSAYNRDFKFSGTISKSSTSAKRLFYSGASGNYVEIVWRADGRIQVTVQSLGQYTSTVVSSNSLNNPNTWYTLDIYQYANTNYMYINFNGTLTSAYVSGKNFLNAGISYSVGSSGVFFKNNLEVRGCRYDGGVSGQVANINCTTTISVDSHVWE